MDWLPLFEIKFVHKHTALPFHLHVVCGYFLTTIAEYVVLPETIWPENLKYLL